MIAEVKVALYTFKVLTPTLSVPTVDSLVLPVFGTSYVYLTQTLLIYSRTAIRRISLLYNRIIVSVWGPTMHCPTYCMDLTLEGLKMTQESRNM
jgi:hypothetical protein